MKKEAEEFDAHFPAKEKLRLPGQLHKLSVNKRITSEGSFAHQQIWSGARLPFYVYFYPNFVNCSNISNDLNLFPT